MKTFVCTLLFGLVLFLVLPAVFPGRVDDTEKDLYHPVLYENSSGYAAGVRLEGELSEDVHVLCNKILAPTTATSKNKKNHIEHKRIEGELSEDVYFLCNRILSPPSNPTSYSDNNLADSARLFDDLRMENKFLKDWLSLVAADSKLAIDTPLLQVELAGTKESDTSSITYDSPVGRLHCEAIYRQQVASLDFYFSAVEDGSLRKLLFQNVVTEMKKQHHNCLTLSAYIQLREDFHKQDLLMKRSCETDASDDTTSLHSEQPESPPTEETEQPTPRNSCLDECHKKAREECDQLLLEVVAATAQTLYDKEADCQARIHHREAGCRQRISLKQFGCEFRVSMKEEECNARVAAKEVDCQQSTTSSRSDDWGKYLATLTQNLDGRWRNATKKCRTWLQGKMQEVLQKAYYLNVR